MPEQSKVLSDSEIRESWEFIVDYRDASPYAREVERFVRSISHSHHSEVTIASLDEIEQVFERNYSLADFERFKDSPLGLMLRLKTPKGERKELDSQPTLKDSLVDGWMRNESLWNILFARPSNPYQSSIRRRKKFIVSPDAGFWDNSNSLWVSCALWGKDGEYDYIPHAVKVGMRVTIDPRSQPGLWVDFATGLRITPVNMYQAVRRHGTRIKWFNDMVKGVMGAPSAFVVEQARAKLNPNSADRVITEWLVMLHCMLWTDFLGHPKPGLDGFPYSVVSESIELGVSPGTLKEYLMAGIDPVNIPQVVANGIDLELAKSYAGKLAA